MWFLPDLNPMAVLQALPAEVPLPKVRFLPLKKSKLQKWVGLVGLTKSSCFFLGEDHAIPGDSRLIDEFLTRLVFQLSGLDRETPEESLR